MNLFKPVGILQASGKGFRLGSIMYTVVRRTIREKCHTTRRYIVGNVRSRMLRVIPLFLAFAAGTVASDLRLANAFRRRKTAKARCSTT
jgi:hypothetical protein